MSDSILYLLTADPLAMPSPERRQWVEALVSELLPSVDEVTIHAGDVPEFLPAVENHEATYCPSCAAEITKWGWDQLTPWYEGDRRDLSVTTPCCGKPTSLNDLDYDGPQGFACFAIEILNPSRELEPGELARLSETAGTPLRVVWAWI